MLDKMLQAEIKTWASYPEVVKAIQDWYAYSGQVVTIWKRGAVYNVETNWVYSFSEAHGNERPGTKIGELVSAPVGKLRKSTLDNLRYILGLEDN